MIIEQIQYYLLHVLALATIVECINAMTITADDYLIVTNNGKQCFSTTGSVLTTQPCTASLSEIWRQTEQGVQNMMTGYCASMDPTSRDVTTIDCTQLNDKLAIEFLASGIGMRSVPILTIAAMKGKWILDPAATCSKPCGGGLRTDRFVCYNERFRNTYCDISKKPEETGKQSPCNIQACVLEDSWSDYGECSSTDCASPGYQVRVCQNADKRKCPGDAYKECPDNCPQAEEEARTKQVGNAPPIPMRLRTAPNGSKWTPYGPCSVNCGLGHHTSYCAEQATAAAGSTCGATKTHTKPCQANTQPGCAYVPVSNRDGVWTEWEGDCSCGVGRETRVCRGQSGAGANCADIDNNSRICVSSTACVVTGDAGGSNPEGVVQNVPQPQGNIPQGGNSQGGQPMDPNPPAPPGPAAVVVKPNTPVPGNGQITNGGSTNGGGTSGIPWWETPTSGGNSGIPNSGGNSGIPNSGGNSGIPNSGGNSGIPNSGGNSGIPNSGGNSGIPSSGGSSGIPNSGGSPSIPNSGGDSVIPDSGGDSDRPWWETPSNDGISSNPFGTITEPENDDFVDDDDFFDDDEWLFL